jgi:uncharacterized protein (TIGR03437 family)
VGSVSATATALGRPAVAAGGVVNAASWAPGLTPGGLATLFGLNLSGNSTTEVLVNGSSARVLFAAAGQLNFLVPSNVDPGDATVQVRTEIGASDSIHVPIVSVQPGIFFDSASGYGAVLTSGTPQWTQTAPVARGGTIEIYGTGLGAVQVQPGGLMGTVTPPSVTVAGAPAEVLFSGLAPGFVGLYQINARVPDGVPSGAQPLVITAAGMPSNTVQIAIR